MNIPLIVTLIGTVTLFIMRRCLPIFSFIVCLIEKQNVPKCRNGSAVPAVDSDMNLGEKSQEWGLTSLLGSTDYEF